MLSNTCKYAVSAVLFLGKNCTDENKRYNIKEISEKVNVPKPYLSKILQELARHQIISSTKGPHGGFGIGQSLEEVRMSQIIEVFEGEDYFHRCVIKNTRCTCKAEEYHCALHKRYEQVRSKIMKFYNETKLSDIVHDLQAENYQF